MAVVLTLAQTKQIRINIHKRNNTKNTVQTIQHTLNTSTHITKTPTYYKIHKLQNNFKQLQSHKDGARPTLFLIFVLFYVFFVLFYIFLFCSMYSLFCDVLCIVCVYMCTELAPPGGYPIAVKYIISYHKIHPNEIVTI